MTSILQDRLAMHVLDAKIHSISDAVMMCQRKDCCQLTRSNADDRLWSADGGAPAASEEVPRVLQQLLDQGAEISGRTVTEERCLGCVTLLPCLPACFIALVLPCIACRMRAVCTLSKEQASVAKTCASGWVLRCVSWSLPCR